MSSTNQSGVNNQLPPESLLVQEALTIVKDIISNVAATQVNKDSTRPVTEADLASEKAIRELITSQTDDKILGEEYGGDLEGQRAWVIDPIDGTANFVHNIPCWGSAIAFREDGVTKVSGIMDPTGTINIAVRDQGLYTSDQGELVKRDPPTTPMPDSLSEALVSTFFNKRRAVFPEYLRGGQELIKTCGNTRVLGAGSYELLLMSRGLIDAFVQYDMNPWDCLPGQLFIIESGGQTNFVNNWFIAARSQQLFDEIVNLVR
jgi:myo-inositol-1(or 4)-monophosphatase